MSGKVDQRGGSQSCGVTRGRLDPSAIEISSVRIIPLEECLTDTDRVNNETRFECTLLHEIVHFVRNEAGLNEADWDNFPDSPMEAGTQFEIWAYGKIGCSAEEIEDAKSSMF